MEQMKSSEEKTEYINTLKKNSEQLKIEGKKIPETNRLDNKRWRFAADIEQLSWRADFLQKSMNTDARSKSQ